MLCENLFQTGGGHDVLVHADFFRSVAQGQRHPYKDVADVVDVVHEAGIAKKVARLTPIGCIKG